MILPIYRPEITLYHRALDGEWDSKGTITNTLFHPLPDEDSLTEAGFRKIVRHGTDPLFRIDAPEGAELIEIGRAKFLKMPNGKKLDAITALACAKMRDQGLDLVRAHRPPAPVRIAPEPVRPRGPVKQLFMFGEDGAA